MKYLGCLLLFFLPLAGISQTSITDLETYPVFADCSSVEFAAEEACFKNTLKDHIVENFQLPEKVTEEITRVRPLYYLKWIERDLLKCFMLMPYIPKLKMR